MADRRAGQEDTERIGPAHRRPSADLRTVSSKQRATSNVFNAHRRIPDNPPMLIDLNLAAPTRPRAAR
jgi:hypothetical protein